MGKRRGFDGQGNAVAGSDEFAIADLADGDQSFINKKAIVVPNGRPALVGQDGAAVIGQHAALPMRGALIGCLLYTSRCV